jgi:hypothetical protein
MSASAEASVVYTGTGTNLASGQVLSASVEFDILTGNKLRITLSNLGAPVRQPSDVLTCLFFDLSGAAALTPDSAVLGFGSTLINGPLPAGQTLGDQWEYLGGLSKTPGGATRGISAAGFGLFNHGDFGSNPQNLGGITYGVINGSPAGGNGQVPTTPLENHSMVFTLRGLPTAFNLANINHVGFQYGTALAPSEPFLVPHLVVPEPSALALLALGAAAFVMRRRHGH